MVKVGAVRCDLHQGKHSLHFGFNVEFSCLQGATLPGTPNTPVSSVTPQGSTTPPCRDTDSHHLYLLASRPTKPCSWPECLLGSTQSVILCTADHPLRMPASPTFMTVVWTIWPIQRFMSFLTAIRFTQSIWSSFTDAGDFFFFLNSGWITNMEIESVGHGSDDWLKRKKLGERLLFARSESLSNWSVTHPKCLWENWKSQRQQRLCVQFNYYTLRRALMVGVFLWCKKKRIIMTEDQSLWRLCYNRRICACLFDICATLFKILVALRACKAIRDFPPPTPPFHIHGAMHELVYAWTCHHSKRPNQKPQWSRWLIRCGDLLATSTSVKCNILYRHGFLLFIHLFIYFSYLLQKNKQKTLLPLHFIQPSIGALPPFPWKVLYLCHNDIQSCDVVFTCGPRAICSCVFSDLWLGSFFTATRVEFSISAQISVIWNRPSARRYIIFAPAVHNKNVNVASTFIVL